MDGYDWMDGGRGWQVEVLYVFSYLVLWPREVEREELDSCQPVDWRGAFKTMNVLAMAPMDGVWFAAL